LHQVEQKIDNLRHRLSLANTDSQRQRIARALDAVEKTQNMLSENTGKIDTVLAKNRVAQILENRAYADIDDKAMRAPEELERAIAIGLPLTDTHGQCQGLKISILIRWIICGSTIELL